MTAGLFERRCNEAGLSCVRQELINWHSLWLIDCLSTVVASESPSRGPNEILRNPRFMKEAERIRRSLAVSR